MVTTSSTLEMETLLFMGLVKVEMTNLSEVLEPLRLTNSTVALETTKYGLSAQSKGNPIASPSLNKTLAMEVKVMI